MKLIMTFIVLNVLNVIVQTAKSIVTIKCGKTVAALVNAAAYGLYTVVIVYTVADIDLWLKVIVVALANLIGVYVVKLFEEKGRKDKLWKVEATVDKTCDWEKLHEELKKDDISHHYIDVEKWVVFNCFCKTAAESKKTKAILDKANAKYFVTETKILN